MDTRIGSIFKNLPKFKSSLDPLRGKKGVVYSGLWNVSRPMLITELQSELNSPVLIINKGGKEEEQLFDDLELINPGMTSTFPAWEILPHEGIAPHVDVCADRFQVLHKLITAPSANIIVTAGISSIIQKVVGKKILTEHILELKTGQSISYSGFIREIFHLGYKRVDRVESVGEYSVRGGIIDVFSLYYEMPYRIEFWGDLVDTIRVFNPATQLSERSSDKVIIFPADEQKYYRNKNELVSFFDYFPDNTLVIIDEPEDVIKKINSIENFICGNRDYYLSERELYASIAKFSHAGVSKGIQSSEPFFMSNYQVLFGINLAHFLENLAGEKKPSNYIDESLFEIKTLIDDGYTVVLSFNNIGEKQRFFEICADKGFDPITSCPSIVGQVSGGFIFPENQFAVISDQEIFGRYKVRRAKRKFKYTAPMREVIDINPGDLVVHVNYGIGMYQGVQKIEQTGTKKDMMVIEYANKAKLFVPLIHSNLVRRYIGCGYQETPPLDVLGTPGWLKKRKQVEESIYDLASEFLEIQAARKVLRGNIFDHDGAWQREFEASFIYDETQDQLNAIKSIKDDMESQRPMDRLICGDVGYGKTEVAIRAAFKAAISGKQVAVLVPTTILAQQHHKVFSERMADYPLRIDMLSRFKTVAEQKKIIKDTAEGNVDILIGTHRLIQNDVKFKDIGLVIIDEEQRFGVRHKEQFKKMRRLVDVLTLTATPIPRTLYLSLVGARDMSTINTPPEDRLPVETYVTTFDEKIIKNAITRELNREGQIYFVHNRIKSIHKIKDKLQQIVPDATIAVGHGQMHEKELAHVMEEFRSGKIDILLCTTIIESGLDIPNANTIIIDRADMFGLADLYQLRGRVGRFKNRAYAYFLVPPYKIPTEQAQKRLDAIETHQHLGAGFQIAMRDLEIRGAGNILGEKQHGNIAAVGFDLYCKLLKNAIMSIKGEQVPELPEVVLKLGLEPAIPADYISSETQRMAIYSRIQDIFQENQVIELQKELEDIYGPVPEDVEILLDCVLIKIYAASKKIDYIELKDDKLLLKTGNNFITEDGLKYYRVKNVSNLKKTALIKSILKEVPQCDRMP